MKQYLELMQHILDHGTNRSDRTGKGTRSVFGKQMRFNLAEGFPLVTTKKVHLKSVIHELLWFLAGDTNIKYLNDHGVTIWNEWADTKGDLGPIYGAQWRSWPYFVWGQAASECYWEWKKQTIDQISNVIHQIRKNPDSRRIIVTAWNPAEVDQMMLPPCHCLFQFYVAEGKLSCQLYQRSCDYFLGVPFNIASYALLTMMVAQITKLELGDFVWTGGDVHLYSDHFEQAKLQLTRTPHPLPRMWMNPAVDDIFKFCYEDFRLENYVYDPHIPAPKAVGPKEEVYER